MIYKKAKLFWKANNSSKEIFCIPMSDNVEYYSFLKKYHGIGYRQIIFTSEIMIQLSEYFVLEKKFSVYDIEFIEDDVDLIEEINNLIVTISNNMAFWSKLIEKLNFLSEKSSIDIQRIYFKGRTVSGMAVKFYLQSNGIIGIDDKNFASISEEISNLIARSLL